MSTLYASFATPSDAERAVGALLDHGAVSADIGLLANERTASGQPVPQTEEVMKSEQSGKSGLSTTTALDVAAGTVKGATIGIGVGTLAALASLFIPGLGLVLGGGAFAAALMGGAGTVIAGAAAGGVAGLLADQGIPEDIVTRYSSDFEQGGAILAIAVPSGKLDASDAEALMVKYGAANVATVNASRPLMDGGSLPAPDPLVVQAENADIAPLMFTSPAPVEVVNVNDPLAMDQTVITTSPVAIANPNDPLSPDQIVAVPVTPSTRVVDEVVDTPVAEPLVDVIDPITGQVMRRPVETVIPGAEMSQMTTLTPNSEVVEDMATGQLHQTVGRGTVISEQPIVVTDPKTGLRQPARLVEEQHAVVREPNMVDDEGTIIMPIDGPSETTVVREKHIEYPE